MCQGGGPHLRERRRAAGAAVALELHGQAEGRGAGARHGGAAEQPRRTERECAQTAPEGHGRLYVRAAQARRGVRQRYLPGGLQRGFEKEKRGLGRV